MVSELQLNSLAKVLQADPAAFQAFADAIPNFVWLSRGDGSLVFLNRPMLEYTGLHPSRDLAGGFYDSIHPDEAAALVAKWHSSVAAGVPFQTEYRLRQGSENTYRWFLARAQPVFDEAGKIAYWIGTSTDIDAQKRAVENLHFVIEASGVFAGANTVERVCSDFAALCVQQFADWCFVVLKDPIEHYRVAAVAHREPERVRSIEYYLERYPVAQDGRLEQLINSGEPVLVASITDGMLEQTARDEEHLRLLRGMNLHSAIVVPLEYAASVVGGIIAYSSESRRRFEQRDVDVLMMLAQRAAGRIHMMYELEQEQRERRRLQFVGRATSAVYESFDLTTAFGNLTQIVVSEIGDMAAVFRLEEGQAARIVGAAHRDPSADDIVRSLVGIRVMHREAEQRFIKSVEARKPLVGTRLANDALSKTVWPYLSAEIDALAPQQLITVPLHSRGKVFGALVAYYAKGGREYKSEDLELLVDIGRHASVALENADVFERERRMSETLQDSLLPPSLPQVEGLSFDAVYLPSATEAQVGGDWYDAFKLEDDTIVVSAGDVTGRGADAAVIMGKIRNLLAIAPSYERDPARILDTVEAVLLRRYPDVIVTAVVGFIAPDRKSITFANAGHPPPLLRTAHGIEELTGEGLPLGLRRDAAPAGSRTADLSDARMMVLYTDGLTESTHDVLMGYRRLREAVLRDALLHTHHPARFIEEACLGSAAPDDVAILTIAFESGIRWSFDAENAKAAQDARGEFVEYLRRHSRDAQAVQLAELVFGELVGNVVRHAPGAIDIDVEWLNGSPTLHVLDRGAAFTAPSHLPDDLLSESGRGLFIVRQLSKGLRVEHVPGYGNHVRVDLPLLRKHE
jgi:PAS domain S-box-containing protein